MCKSHAELAKEVDIKHKPQSYYSTMASLLNKEVAKVKLKEKKDAEIMAIEKEKARLKKLQKERANLNIQQESRAPSLADMEDLPEMEYDGLSETPIRAGNSHRYRSQMDNSEPAPLKFHSVKPSVGVHSPYAGNMIKPEL